MDKFKIGEIATKSQVNIETIRFYERKGLISPIERLASGYRIYSIETVKKINFIKRSKELGFTLNEIKELLALRIPKIGNCQQINRRTEEKLTEVKKKIATLSKMKKSLEKLIVACNNNQPSKCCPILGMLDKGD